MDNIRLQRGQEISGLKDAIKRIDEYRYTVNSQSGNGSYEVIATELGWNCSCPDHKFRGVKCKHVYTVEVSFALRKEVEVTRIEPITNTTNCIFWNCSNVVKFGIRHNNRGDIQKFRCNDCKHSAMQLYFTGESLRNVERFLKLQGVKLQGVNSSHMSVYRWIKKYVVLMEKYLEKIRPNVSSVWRTDELYLKVKGNIKYLCMP